MVFIPINTYGMYAYGMYTYGMYTYGMYTYGMYTYGMYAYGMYAYGMYVFHCWSWDQKCPQPVKAVSSISDKIPGIPYTQWFTF